jgi:hypothetical protein
MAWLIVVMGWLPGGSSWCGENHRMQIILTGSPTNLHIEEVLGTEVEPKDLFKLFKQ